MISASDRAEFLPNLSATLVLSRSGGVMILLAIGGDFGRRDLGDERFVVFRCNETGWELELNPESSLPFSTTKSLVFQIQTPLLPRLILFSSPTTPFNFAKVRSHLNNDRSERARSESRASRLSIDTKLASVAVV